MSDMKCPVCKTGNVEQGKYDKEYFCDNEFCPSYDETDSSTYDILIRTRKALDKGMEHITGLNNMIESWLNLIDGDLDQETKLRILKSAISAYVENKGGDNE